MIETKATIPLKEFGINIDAAASDSPFNLLCLHRFCQDNKMDYIELGSLGLPPYALLPGRERGVVFQIKGETPIYKQNHPNFQPEKVV